MLNDIREFSSWLREITRYRLSPGQVVVGAGVISFFYLSFILAGKFN